MSETIIKFNPYHDELGRFTSSDNNTTGGGGGVGSGSGSGGGASGGGAGDGEGGPAKKLYDDLASGSITAEDLAETGFNAEEVWHGDPEKNDQYSVLRLTTPDDPEGVDLQWGGEHDADTVMMIDTVGAIKELDAYGDGPAFSFSGNTVDIDDGERRVNVLVNDLGNEAAGRISSSDQFIGAVDTVARELLDKNGKKVK